MGAVAARPQIVPTDAILPQGSRGFLHLSSSLVRSHLLDTMCRTRGDRQARQDRGRCLTEGTGGAPRGVAPIPRDRATVFRDFVGKLSAGAGRARNAAVVASAR